MKTSLIKELRDRTSVSMNECKTALEESGGDLDLALVVLQKRGLHRAGQMASRATGEGRIFSYIHGPGKIAVLVEITCETDFASASQPFLDFGETVAMQIAALAPTWVRRDEVPEAEKDQQLSIFAAQVFNKPEQARNKIAEGKLNKWYSEVCLSEQESVSTPKKTVEDLRAQLVSTIRENVVIRRFTRWQAGA